MNLLRRTVMPTLLLVLALCGPGLISQPVQAAINVECPPDSDGIDTDGDGIVDNDHACIHLAATDGFAKMGDGKILYTFGFVRVTPDPVQTNDPNHTAEIVNNYLFKANWPAPTLALKEGQKLYLTLTTLGFVHRPDLFDPHSIHWHGIPNAATFYDGEPMASFGVNMGSSFTYFYNIIEAGTYMYHCHVEATEHMQMGMLGNLYVRPKQDANQTLKNLGTPPYQGFAYNDGDGSTGYHVAYPIQLHAFDPVFHDTSFAIGVLNFAWLEDRYAMMNGRGYPDTTVEGDLPAIVLGEPVYSYAPQKTSSLIKATAGQRILLRIANLSFDYYTLTALGLPMQVVGRDAKTAARSHRSEPFLPHQFPRPGRRRDRRCHPGHHRRGPGPVLSLHHQPELSRQRPPGTGGHDDRDRHSVRSRSR